MTPALARRLIRAELANNVLGAGDNLLKIGRGRILEPGVVAYDNEDGSRTTYLLPRDAIERGRPSAKGKPLIGSAGGFDHMKVNAADQAAGKYDGDAFEAFDNKDGWESILFKLNDAETAKRCEDGYQFSCAYIPTEVDETPGVWHNVPYDAVIKNLEYTHFAIVPNPRYDGAKIELLNSRKEPPIMNKVLKAALSLFPIKDVKEVLNSIEEDEKKKAAEELEKKNAEREQKRSAAQQSYDAAMKNASSDEDRQKAKEAFEKANAEIDAPAGAAAPSSSLPAQPLGGGDVPPEPGVAQPATAGASVAANAETPEQAQEREKKALEARNAAEADEKAKKDKEAEEKKNAEDAAKKEAADKAKKEEDEKKNALALKVKAEAAAKADAERRERFNALKRAAEERGGQSGTAFVGVVTQQEKEDLGRERYGSGQA